MYIQTLQPKQRCSVCKSIDRFEILQRRSIDSVSEIRRCTVCGHEKVICTTTSTRSDSGRVYDYSIEKTQDIEDW